MLVCIEEKKKCVQACCLLLRPRYKATFWGKTFLLLSNLRSFCLEATPASHLVLYPKTQHAWLTGQRNTAEHKKWPCLFSWATQLNIRWVFAHLRDVTSKECQVWCVWETGTTGIIRRSGFCWVFCFLIGVKGEVTTRVPLWVAGQKWRSGRVYSERKESL